MHGVNHWPICCHPKAPVLCTGFYHWTTSCYSSALLKYFVQAAICFFLSVFFYQKKCLCTWKHKKQQCNLHARCEPLAHLLSSQSSSTVYNLKIRFFWKKGLCDDKHNKTATQIKCITVSLMGREGHASWGMHRDLLEVKGGLWQHRWTRSLHRIQQNVWSILATRLVWESQALPSPYPPTHPPTHPDPTPPPGGE